MTEKSRRKERVGVVVSNKMQKTVVVAVETFKRHRIYKKLLRKTRRLKVHDEANACGLGDLVRIVETRPLSKEKRWRVGEVLVRGEVAEVAPKEIGAQLIEELMPKAPPPVVPAAPAEEAEAAAESAEPVAEAEAVQEAAVPAEEPEAVQEPEAVAAEAEPLEELAAPVEEVETAQEVQEAEAAAVEAEAVKEPETPVEEVEGGTEGQPAAEAEKKAGDAGESAGG